MKLLSMFIHLFLDAGEKANAYALSFSFMFMPCCLFTYLSLWVIGRGSGSGTLKYSRSTIIWYTVL